jgi:hypothetical protein
MKTLLPFLTLTLTACDRDAPSAPSAHETTRLDEAEDMLNAMSTNEEGPEASAPDPSANAN